MDKLRSAFNAIAGTLQNRRVIDPLCFFIGGFSGAAAHHFTLASSATVGAGCAVMCVALQAWVPKRRSQYESFDPVI